MAMDGPALPRKSDSRRRMIARAANAAVATAIARLTVAALAPGCDRGSAYGIRLVAFDESSRGQGELFFARVTLALGLIERYDPRWIRRMRRDFSGIWLGGSPGAPCFDVMTRRCVLNWNSVMYGGILDLALTLIHEATHARIASRGMARHPVAPAVRQEGAAVRQEMAFVALMPATGDRLRHLATKLDDPWWTPERMLQRLRAWNREAEIPDWLARRIERRYEEQSCEEPG